MKNIIRKYKVSLLLSVVATALASGMVGNVLSHIVQEYALTNYQNGFVSSCISFGSLAALILGSSLRNRVSKAAFISAGGLLMAVTLILQGFPVTFELFLVMSVFLGIGIGIIDSNQSSFFVDLDPKHTGQNLGILHGIFGLGGLLLPILIRQMLQAMDWRCVYLVLGLASLILVAQFLIFSVTAGKQVPQAKRLEKSNSFKQTAQFLHNPQFLVLLLCMFLGAAAQNGILVWTVRYVGDFLMNKSLAATALSVFWATSTVSRIFSARLPFPPLGILGLGSALAGLAWGVAIYTDSALTVLFACAVAGLGSGCCIPILLNEGAEFNRENAGLVTNLMMIVKTAGQMASPLLISYIMEWTSMKTAMFWIMPLFVVDGIAAGILLQIKKRKAFL